MTSVTFLLKDDPFGVDAGDTHISRLIIEQAAEAYEVRGIALSQDEAAKSEAPIQIRTVPSPPRSIGAALRRGLSSGRSLLHGYFRIPALTAAIGEDDADVLLAEHTYMAESAIDSGRASGGADADARLLINSHALQSSVLAQRRSPPVLSGIEARRTWRDELRCVAAADSTACLGQDDLERLSEAGAQRLRRLDLILPPAERRAQARKPRALFFGTRYRWPPNAYALEKLLELWPRILAEVPGAELVVAGRPGERERPLEDPSVRVLGYVEDLDELLLSSSALLAPVPIGGGVRVKMLDAIRHGLAAVGSPEAVGSIGDYLPIEAASDDDVFCDRAIELLASPERAREEGDRLYEASRELWQSGFVSKQVVDWIGA
jgi:glycosyltransferase involved in cell wall biosynthesis